MDNGYPSLMCFGNEPYKCDHEDSCPRFEDCKEKYNEGWFWFTKDNDINDDE